MLLKNGRLPCRAHWTLILVYLNKKKKKFVKNNMEYVHIQIHIIAFRNKMLRIDV